MDTKAVRRVLLRASLWIVMANSTIAAKGQRQSMVETLPSQSVFETQRLVDWLRTSGGFFHPNISLDPPNGHNAVGGGVYAMKDIQKDELLMFIPENSLFYSRHEQKNASRCETAARLVEAYVVQGEQGSEFWPYVQYVFESYRHDRIPSAWSKAAKRLANGIVTDFYEPRYFGSVERCKTMENMLEDTELFGLLRAAMRIVDSRGWDGVLAPVGDMANHRNGHGHNMDQLQDSAVDKNIRLVALRDIQAGEQLHLSYNQCPDQTCYGQEYTYTTQHIFGDYGFVELFPQRWRFNTTADGSEILLFDIEERFDGNNSNINSNINDDKNYDKYIVRWIFGTPKEEQMEWLEIHLMRLYRMRDSVMFKANRLDDSHEANMAIEYYKALIRALELAHQWAAVSEVQ